MYTIKLNFINRSDDTNNNSVVVFQKNIAESANQNAVAWKVISNCGRLCNHPFKYPLNFQVCYSDPFGNFKPKLTAFEGQAFEAVRGTSGDVLQLAAASSLNPREVEIRNNLPMGSIDARCYRDNKLVAIKNAVSPGQKAIFGFHPTLYIGVVSQIEEGEVMSPELVAQANTEINLFGILSADIVMTGGGPGRGATPFLFRLENINK